MILLGIIDDFVFQVQKLNVLKQKSEWVSYIGNLDDFNRSKYKYDYIMATLIHGFSWSIMVHLPFIVINGFKDSLVLSVIIIIQAILHAFVDDLKANRYKINLWQDQTFHIMQTMISFYILTSINN
jgi:hypothetical protein